MTTLRFEPYTADRAPAVRAFNGRLDAAAMPGAFRLPVDAPEPAPAPPARPAVYSEWFLAVDGDDVRGGVMLQHQQFVVGAAEAPAVNIQLPLSEGWADNRFGFVGMWLIKQVLRRHPRTFAVGMGGMEQPLPKLLVAMGWDVRPVPFFFHVHNAGAFLRQMPQLRRTRARAAAADVAAATGAGWAALRAVELFRRATAGGRAPELEASAERGWGAWADDVWRGAQRSAALVGVRDRRTLAALYPPAERQLIYRLRDRGADVGWVTLLRTPMRDSKYFGNLVVGTILDALTLPGYELAAVRAARRVLTQLGADLSVSNQTHGVWQAALRTAGYIAGPSNYLLATSKPLTEAVRAAAPPDGRERMHVTRGDGDGRIHL